MSKARPHAHVYEKWVRGIRTAVPDEKERCGLYEYIIAYQLAKIYDAAELPRVQDLSSAAAVALAMLEGDLEELCEERKENNARRRENGVKNAPSSPEQPLAGTSSPLQSNTIQNNTIQNNNNAMQALENLAEQSDLSEFNLGLALLSKGYIIKSKKLHEVYERAKSATNPLAYAEKAGFTNNQNRNAGAPCAHFVEATGCKDTRALEIYGVTKEDAVLCVSCTAAAEKAIGQGGVQNAMRYARQVGANDIIFYANAE